MSELDPTQASALLAEILANHFPGATIEGATVTLNLAGVRARCQAWPDEPHEGARQASLYFWLSGGPWAGREVYASVSGYGPTVREAIVTGGCNWGCTVAPVLRAALGAPGAGPAPHHTRRVVDGTAVDIYVEGLDRALARPDEGAPPDLIAQVRHALTGPGAVFLAERVVSAGVLPVWTSRPGLLSVFVAESAERRIVEIKVDGVDWPPAATVFDAVPRTTHHGMAMLREVAMVVPGSPGPLTRSAVQRTVDGLSSPLGERVRPTVDWRGWEAHSGLLDPPMRSADLAELEAAVGPLPEDYRRFLAEVSEGGAGPGYGLLSPDHSAQVEIARGAFPHEGARTETDTPAETAGALVLAEAGCGLVWLLVLEGPHRGQVWVDAQGSSGGIYPVAPSFDAWYRAWLDNGVGGLGPWLHWNPDSCAPSSAIRQALEGYEGERDQLLTGARITLQAGGSRIFHPGDAIDPCEACFANLRYYGMAAEDLGRGLGALQGR